ncbi:MAG: hypothetical protein LUI10_09365 [Lachnospiraceae bacterium]|nr:hypothetical protein [Lachnospiraceae bacterium]
MERLEMLYIGAVCRATALKQKAVDFWKSEKGVSNIVATIILLLIVVLIIGVFWDQLSTWLSKMMNNIFNSSYDNSSLESGISINN